MSVNQHWHDPVAESYAATIAHKVPGYHLLHELTVDRVEIDLMGAASRMLTVGAGGGEEIINMLQRNKDWHITGLIHLQPCLIWPSAEWHSFICKIASHGMRWP